MRWIFLMSNYLCLDTNVLIDLFEMESKNYSEEVLNKFLSAVLTRSVILVLPRLILEEWERNYPKKIDKKLKDVNDQEVKLLDKVDSFEFSKHQQDIKEKLEEAHKISRRIVKYKHGLSAQKINRLLRISDTVVIDRTPLSDEKVVEFALNKEAPFFSKNDGDYRSKNEKNEAADATIFFSLYSYLKTEPLEENETFFFISNNKADYSDEKNSSELHSKLKPYASEVKMQFSNNLKGYLDDIENNILKDFVFDMKYIMDKYFVTCPNCAEEVHVNIDTFIKDGLPPHLQTHWYKCPSCEHSWDTGDLVIDY